MQHFITTPFTHEGEQLFYVFEGSIIQYFIVDVFVTAAAYIEQLFDELNLTSLAKKRAVSLSGGERRRLEITRALVTNPTFLLLDEPFANIDPISVSEVKEMVKHLSEKGISILITDHNAREIFTTVHRSYLVRDGRVMISGTVDELVNNEEARATYFGANFTL